MTKYYLHTGLHKTGTKFFQHKVFPNLPKEVFNYNPPELCQYVCDLMKAEEDDVSVVIDAIHEEKKRLESHGVKKVLISREIMSGDLFSFYEGYKERYSRLQIAFPEAEVIISLRYQPDWILSCYRETLHEHHFQTVGQFLGLEEGDPKFVKAEYSNLDYDGILSHLVDLFGQESLHVFFYEKFREDKLTMVRKVADVLGAENIPITDDGDSIPNRGYSALAAKVSVLRYRLLSTINLENLFVHRPIYFFGDNSIPAGFEELSVLPKDKYWHSGFLRDNEEVRSDGYPNNLTITERFKLRTSWRNLIKDGLDKLWYKDWDMLSPYREELDNYFKMVNQKLLNKHKTLFDEVPSIYL